MRNCTVAESLHTSTLPRDRRGAISQHSSRPSYGIEIFQDVPAEAEAGRRDAPEVWSDRANRSLPAPPPPPPRKVGVKALLH